MPYDIIKLDDGTFKVCKKDRSKCFSKKGLTLNKAKKQLKAIGISEHLKGGRYNYYRTMTAEEKANDPYVRWSNSGSNLSFEEWTKQDPATVERNRQHQERIDQINYENSPEGRKALNEAKYQQYLKEHPTQAFFDKAVKGLTNVADFLVENVADKVGVPKIVTDVYKNFGPPTSKYYQGSGKPINQKLYNKIKEEVYKRNPKHSLYRSALIQKIYQSEGGKYKNYKEPSMNIKKWFKQDWISLNDYLRGNIVPCGNSNTEEKFNEYPLCRPLKIAEKLSDKEIKKMIKEKNKLKEKPLISEKILDRKDVNIKSTNTGLGKSSGGKFKKQLQKLNITEEEYLDYAKKVAKMRGYDPDKLELANDDDHKLKYNGVKFGKVGYNDFLLYLHQVKEGLIPFEFALEKMKNYRARATKIKGDWMKDKESPNNLAINIIW